MQQGRKIYGFFAPFCYVIKIFKKLLKIVRLLCMKKYTTIKSADVSGLFI